MHKQIFALYIMKILNESKNILIRTYIRKISFEFLNFRLLKIYNIKFLYKKI